MMNSGYCGNKINEMNVTGHPLLLLLLEPGERFQGLMALLYVLVLDPSDTMVDKFRFSGDISITLSRYRR